MRLENWNNIVNYEGVYLISDLGRVMSINRTKPIILRQWLSTGRYPFVKLRKEGKTNSLYIHILVAKAFLNHKPCGHKVVVDHIDGNPANNKLENLRLVTQRENVLNTCVKSLSDFAGVSWHKGNNKWQSTVHFEGKKIHLGYYKNEKDAHKRYESFLKSNL